MHPLHHSPILKNGSHSKEKEKIEDPGEQAGAINDKYLRLMAEFENYKRRSAKEHERLVEAADEQIIKELIEVREDFGRAFASKDRGEKFAIGMKLNYAKMNFILQKHGLEAYGEPGDKFDPELHEALLCSPNETVPDLHITEVLERGYRVKGKIIKHAKVAVSSGFSDLTSI
jgi:molecular chaperone GrpE